MITQTEAELIIATKELKESNARHKTILDQQEQVLMRFGCVLQPLAQQPSNSPIKAPGAHGLFESNKHLPTLEQTCLSSLAV